MPEDQAQLAAKRERVRQSLDGPQVWLYIILAMLLLAAAIIYFGKNENYSPVVTTSETPEPTESMAPFRTYSVSYRNGVFSPTNLRIHAGDTVRFKNDGILPIHIVADENNPVGFDSIGDVPGGSFFSFTFAARGTFGYHNSRNLNETGTIIVR